MAKAATNGGGNAFHNIVLHIRTYPYKFLYALFFYLCW